MASTPIFHEIAVPSFSLSIGHSTSPLSQLDKIPRFLSATCFFNPRVPTLFLGRQVNSISKELVNYLNGPGTIAYILGNHDDKFLESLALPQVVVQEDDIRFDGLLADVGGSTEHVLAAVPRVQRIMLDPSWKVELSSIKTTLTLLGSYLEHGCHGFVVFCLQPTKSCYIKQVLGHIQQEAEAAGFMLHALNGVPCRDQRLDYLHIVDLGRAMKRLSNDLYALRPGDATLLTLAGEELEHIVRAAIYLDPNIRDKNLVNHINGWFDDWLREEILYVTVRTMTIKEKWQRDGP